MRSEMNTNSRGYEIDFRDLLARLLDKWVIILVFLLIGAAVGSFLAIRHNRGQQDRKVTEADVEQARQALSKEEADHVEYLYHQYVSYSDYRNQLERYLSDSLYADDEFDNSIILNAVYYVDSSELMGAEKVLKLLALDMDDCREIAQILGIGGSDASVVSAANVNAAGPVTDAETKNDSVSVASADDDMLVKNSDTDASASSASSDFSSLDDVYRRVHVSGVTGVTDRVDVKLSTEQAMSRFQLEDRTGLQDEHMLQLWVIADTPEQAEQIREIAEASFERSLRELQKIDPGVEMTCLGEKYSTDVYAFFNERQTELAADLHDASYQVYRLRTEYIDEMEPAEKELFETLKAMDNEHFIYASSVSLKKNLLIGAVIGLIVGALLVILQYLLSGRLKNVKELSERFQVEVPYVIYRKMKRFRLFGGLIRKLTRADLSDVAIRQKMAAWDIAIKLDKSGCRSVSLLCDDVTSQETEMASALAEQLKEKNHDIEVMVCNPLTGTDELEAFSGMDAAILVTQIKKSQLNTLQKWSLLCERYEVPVAGAVALEEC